MRAYVLVLAAVAVTALHGGQASGGYSSTCGVGVRWDETENGWSGTWTRRGNSDTFDGVWRNSGNTGSSVLTMTATGNKVHIERRDSATFNNGLGVAYDVVIAADGTATGTGRILPAGASFPMRATVTCGGTTTANVPPPASVTPASNPSLSCGLGTRWDEEESGWNGTWTRRGTSSTFDAAWRNSGNTGSSVLTMTATGNKVHIERRDSASFNAGLGVAYDVVIAADGTATGTGRILPAGASFPMRATVTCGGTTTANVPPPASVTPASNPSLSCGLGTRWDEEESGWNGTWTRRGTSSTFDAAWRNSGNTGSSVLTMTATGNKVHIERRDSASFNAGLGVAYDVVVAADGKVTGTGRILPAGASFPMRATVTCGGASTPAPSAAPVAAPSGTLPDLSGTWDLKVNGFKMELYLKQQGAQIRGWIGVNGVNVWSDVITGTVTGNEIQFTRTAPSLARPQEYRGYLLPHDNPQIEPRFRMTGADALAGIGSHVGVWNMGWFATRVGPYREQPAR